MPDANGVEALEGESEVEYVARQARLREEAAARMRAKFGGSGGLNGSMRMGGIGSASACGNGGGGSTSELLSSLGSSASGGLSSLASNASWFLGSAKETASSLAASVAERAATSRAAEDPWPQEESRDISDLLGSAAVSDRPPSRPATKPVPSMPKDDWSSWDAVPAPKSSEPTMTPSLPKGSWDMPPATPATPPPSTHVSLTPASTGGRRKVAAVKVGADKSWDDWGDKW